jgi:putative DNA primase/helicase
MNLTQIARALGGEISNGQVLAPGPGHSPKDRSLYARLSADAPDGLLVGSFAGDDWRTCKDYVRQRLGMPPFDDQAAAALPRERISRPAEPEPSEDRKRDAALRIWTEAVNPFGTIVETYLRSRSLTLADSVAGRVIRFHPVCPWREGETTIRVPAMIAAMRSIETDEICCIQRTRLTTDGKKIDRWMLGPSAGAAIKIDDDSDISTGLTIGEGFETCLSGRQLGFRPVWALGSVGAIAKFPVLAGIEALTIFAEAGNPSRKAVDECAQRWHEAGREVVIVEPLAGSDLNDAIREVAA